jgi:hypothetical protein
MNRWPPVPDAPTLNSITPNPSLDGNYTVSWAAGAGPAPTSYDLEENGVVILTSYASTSRSFSGKAIGTYTYRVRGKNSYGTGPWSSPQQVTVQAQPSGPTPGFWKGSGVEFYVTSDRAYVHYFAIYITVSGCGSYKIRHNSPDASISGNQFSFSGSFYATGTFDSAAAAHGTTGLNRYYISGCGYITGSTSWSATWQNSSQAIFMPASVIETDTVEPTTVMSDFIVTPVP